MKHKLAHEGYNGTKNSSLLKVSVHFSLQSLAVWESDPNRVLLSILVYLERKLSSAIFCQIK